MTIFHRINMLTPMTLALLGLLTLTGLIQTALGEDNRTIACIEPPLERYGTAIEEPAHHFNLSPDCVVQVPGEPGTDDENRHLGVGLCFPELIRCDEANNNYYQLNISNNFAPEAFSRVRESFSATFDEYLSTTDYKVFITPKSIRDQRDRTLYIYTPRTIENLFATCHDTALNCVLHGKIDELGIEYNLRSNNMAFRDWVKLHDAVKTLIRASIEED